jgi:hypothetical protein
VNQPPDLPEALRTPPPKRPARQSPGLLDVLGTPIPPRPVGPVRRGAPRKLLVLAAAMAVAGVAALLLGSPTIGALLISNIPAVLGLAAVIAFGNRMTKRHQGP